MLEIAEQLDGRNEKMINSSKEYADEEELPFPKLMEGHDGTIVLFTDPTTGTIVKKGRAGMFPEDDSEIGYHSATFFSSKFIDYTGKVVLANKQEK